MKKRILLAAIALLLVTGLVAAYFLYIKQPTSKELYRQAVDNAISTDSKEAYISFSIDSGDTKLKGEFKGDISGDSGRVRGDMNISSNTDDGIPLSLAMEIIAIEEKDKSEVYSRYKSLTSSNAEYNQNIVDYYAPAIDKWTKLDDDNEDGKPANFEEDGSLAAFDTLGIFAPVTSISDADKKIFLAAVDKYNLYEVDEKTDKTRFKGIEARKIRVTVTKDVFTEFENEASGAISKDSGFEKFETKFVDQLFGKDNKFSADVYLSPKTTTIIGVDMSIDLDSPIKETAFDTTLDKIATSMLVEYGRSLSINAPEKFITQKELDAILSR